ncbi:MAG: hypothetical protein RID53_32395, partial [Coleofasciculus sp. B1-GNL1-01]
ACKVDQIRVSSHFSTQQVPGFYTITVLHPGIFADNSTKFYLDRGSTLSEVEMLKPFIAHSLFPIASPHHKTYSAASK